MSLRLVSLAGVAALLAMAWGLSNDRRRFPWRTVFWGLSLQFLLALLILRTQPGLAVFDLGQRAVARLIGFANEGSRMAFGALANPEVLARSWGADNAIILCVTVTATIILVSSFSALLYHWGILQRIVQAMAWVMQHSMGTSGSESLAAAANIFMGQTEAPLVIKPYLRGMTNSELLALMTGGMATIAGGVLAAYVGFGVSAGHLLTASVMSAPASLMLAKIMFPPQEPSPTAGGCVTDVPRETVNSLDALCRGASDGMMLSLNVAAMLIAFVALVAMANYLFALPQRWLGAASPISLQVVLGWLNAPFAFMMGVAPADCVAFGQVLGERIVLNEFVGYLSLIRLEQAAAVSPRTVTLATYALCGFANFGSIAIQIGGIGALVPERRADLARLGLKAMIAGLLACYLTAAIVGVLTP